MHEEHPELLKDQYWDDVIPKELPYTVASEHYRREEPKGSAENYKVKTTDAMYANLLTPLKKTMIDDMYADYVSILFICHPVEFDLMISIAGKRRHSNRSKKEEFQLVLQTNLQNRHGFNPVCLHSLFIRRFVHATQRKFRVRKS